ncbi:MAG: YHS domain-containing protein [Proteobacteria bacterium]|nr:YHS domain-containing protein [Pseudomonadota bacterium]
MGRIFPSIHRRLIVAAAAGGVALLALAPAERAFAYDEGSTSSVNVDAKGVAVRGYDPVAYFTAGAPTKGSDEFQAKHQGATYHFASAANRDAFMKEPAKYAPAFGGFCAMGAVFGKKLDGDPSLWRIVDGKLYLNVGAPAAKRWREDIAGNITKANANWPKIMEKAPKDL